MPVIDIERVLPDGQAPAPPGLVQAIAFGGRIVP